MKRFLPKFIITFAILFGCIAIYRLFIHPHVTRDLGGIRKLIVGQEYQDKIHSLFQFDTTYVITWREGMNINKGSIIVIGDSFSNREDPSQQGYMTENSWSKFTAEILGTKIINIWNYKISFTPEDLFVSIMNENVLPDSCIVILESVERAMVSRLTTNYIDDNLYQTYVDGLKTAKTTRETPMKKKKTDWVSETTKFMRFRLGKECAAHKFGLKQQCFDHPLYGMTLFTYHDDENNMINNYDEIVPQMHNRLDSIFDIAVKHHIKLIYMIAADKYDVYEPLITNRHKQNHLLDYFPSNDSILNTKELLQPYILAGTLDVYRLDDTHWTPLGSKIVGEEVADRIKRMCLQ